MNILDALEVAHRVSEEIDDDLTRTMAFYAFKIFVKKLYEEGFEITPVVQGDDAKNLMRRWVGKESE